MCSNISDKLWVSIIGMERTGTSMLSNIFIDSGICMTHTKELNRALCDPFIYDNALFNHEDYEALYINESILKRADHTPNDGELLSMMHYVQKRYKDFEHYNIIGFKDPRLSLLYKYWDVYIDCKKVVVFTMRTPHSTILSRRYAGEKDDSISKYMWIKYNKSIYSLFSRLDCDYIQIIYEYFLYDELYRNIIVNQLESLLGCIININTIDIYRDHSDLKFIRC